MLELVKNNIDITLDKLEDRDILTIKGNQSGSLSLDWLKDDYKNLDVVIGENVNIIVTETEEKASHVISYTIGDNSSVSLNIFTSGRAKENTYAFDLGEASSLEVAYADFSFGKKELFAKVNLNKRLASVRWHLASLSQNDDYKNYVVNFNHIVGETFARMENYGVCKDNSTLNFLGDAVIMKGAKKASTNQIAKIMVFDKTCHAKASPKLCIDENDVEAAHGASEGQINTDHVFYLMSRGLSEDEAKRLITFGYLYPIMQYFSDEDVRKSIEECIVKRV